MGVYLTKLRVLGRKRRIKKGGEKTENSRMGEGVRWG